MIQAVHEKASVITIHDHVQGRTIPWRIKWRGRIYTITELGLHHTLYEGRILHHFFTVTDGSLYFRLKFNTETLSWLIEEVSENTD